MTLNRQALEISIAKAGLSLVNTARLSGVGLSTVSKAINGKTALRRASIGKLAKALDVEVEELIED